MTAELETTFTFRNLDSTEALRDHTMEKLEKIQKYLVRQTASAHIIFKVEGPRHTAEIALNIKGHRYFGEETSNDMYASIDSAVHRLEAQMSRDKDRITGHKA
ncbi:MAG: ribosome-associated translation inhibitor RaiA [Deltaproteobacteria bacterium]|nr:ribosome-associated translation inhibitor RaiA [Deltaproteobacteria bacterium]